MNIKQHIRMTASEIAMGRYMRAPDHASAQDEFNAAFSTEALKEVVEDKVVAPVAAADPPAADPPAADPPATDPPAADPPATDPPAADPPAADPPAADPPAADPPAADPPAADPTAKAPEADADAILDRLAEAVASKQPKGAPAAEAPVAEAPAAEAPPMFDEAETAVLAKFKDDWPEEHKAIQLMQRELGIGITRYVFDQIAPAVKEIKEMTDALAQFTGSNIVTEALTEYPSDEEIDQIKAWVQTQPPYLQGGMNNVITSGTPDDVIDLVTRYREATGAKPAGAQDPAPKPQEAELSGAAKQAVAALAPVGSKRSVVQDPEDTSNFEAAWEKYKDAE